MTTEKRIKWDGRATITAIVGVTVIMSVGLIAGHNGHLMALAVAAVAGLGGYSIRRITGEVTPHA